MKFKHYLVCVFVAMFLVACAGISLNTEQSTTVLEKTAASTCGYLIAKNNKKYIPAMLTYYSQMQEATTLDGYQTAFKLGMAKLSQMISTDPFLQLQVQNLLSMVQINVDGPQLEIDLSRYKAITDSFMAGVQAAQAT